MVTGDHTAIARVIAHEVNDALALKQAGTGIAVSGAPYAARCGRPGAHGTYSGWPPLRAFFWRHSGGPPTIRARE